MTMRRQYGFGLSGRHRAWRFVSAAGAALAAACAPGIQGARPAGAGAGGPARHHRGADPECDSVVTDAAELRAFLADPPRKPAVTACVSGTLELASTPAGCGPTCGDDPEGSHFCLAPPERVHSLAIVGMDGPDGSKATIHGGFNALCVPASATTDSLRVDNLRIVDSTVSAMLNFDGGELTLTHVDIEGVIPFEIPAFGASVQLGVQVSSSYEDIVGPITIASDTIDAGDHYDGVSVLLNSSGIGVLGQFAVPLQTRAWTGTGSVHDNVVRHWAGSGILALQADVEIADNTVETGPFANDIAVLGTRGDCAANSGLGSAGGISVFGDLPVSLSGNTVVMKQATLANGDTPSCQGAIVLLDSTGAQVRDTVVRGAGVSTARGIVAIGASSATVEDFRVEGGQIGVDLADSDGNALDDGYLGDLGTGIRLADSSDNAFSDIAVAGTTDAVEQDASSTGNTFDDVHATP